MLLYVEEFKATTQRHIDFVVEGEERDALLQDTDYSLVGPLLVSANVERIGTTFRVSAEVKATVAYDCGRCLEHREQLLEINPEWVLMEKKDFVKKYSTQDEFELSAEDLDVSVYEGEEINLSDLLRESVLLELPTYARCPEGSTQCDSDYERNVGSKAIIQNEEASGDLRWSALKDLKLSSKK